MTIALYEPFLESARRHPQAVALEVAGEAVTYTALRDDALSIAATLAAHRGPAADLDSPRLTAVLGHRSRAAFAGTLGVLASGHGYVPLLPTLPTARLHGLIERSAVHAVVVDHHAHAQLAELLARVSRPVTWLSPNDAFDPALRNSFPQHTLLDPTDMSGPDQWQAPTVDGHDIAYLLFTSGSTGEPKGVMVSHDNIAHFLDTVTTRYALTASDRFSQMFDPTFDLSLFDMFAAWGVGACVCCPDNAQRLLPHRFIADAKLTVWFSVPSVARLMGRMRTLTPDAFRSLRWSLFCGEALTEDVATRWSDAAPNALLENIYGPTEVTLACTGHRWSKSNAATPNGIVPIGEPFPGMRTKVVGPDLVDVAPGDPGELLMAGPQVALGYWRDPERTAAAFVVPPGETTTYYRTGDRVRRPSPTAPLQYLGRLDHQIKIHGHRVELGEIEAAVRKQAQVDTAIAIGWPRTPSGADGIVAFIDDAAIDPSQLLRRLATLLPAYMVPKRICVIDAFPLNANGKVDRNALLRQLDES